MKELELRINSWFTDDDKGWGLPSYVLKRMKQANWCCRTWKVLQGQLGSSAILLSAAFGVRSKKTIDLK